MEEIESEVTMMLQDTVESANLKGEKRFEAVYSAMKIIQALFRDGNISFDDPWNMVPNFSEKLKDIQLSYTMYKVNKKTQEHEEISICSNTGDGDKIITVLEMLMDTIDRADKMYETFEKDAIKNHILKNGTYHFKLGMKNSKTNIYLEIDAESGRNIKSLLNTFNTLLTYFLIMYEYNLRGKRKFYMEKLHNEVLDANEMRRCSYIQYTLSSVINSWLEIEHYYALRVKAALDKFNIK